MASIIVDGIVVVDDTAVVIVAIVAVDAVVAVVAVVLVDASPPPLHHNQVVAGTLHHAKEDHRKTCLRKPTGRKASNKYIRF